MLREQLRGNVVDVSDAPNDSLYALLQDEGIDDAYPQAVLDEVRTWQSAPGIDDEGIDDLTQIPFVTVDGPSTRDLDQALFVERRGAGYGVLYAIADASHFVRAGSALFDEALRRGASYYLPGAAVPMLPRALSEGLVSLGPQRDRRAMVFDMTLDALGHCTNTTIRRARMHSRHQLTFDHVQNVLRGQGEHPVQDEAIVGSLQAMREVGALRTRLAALRGVVPYHRTEVRVKLRGGEDTRLTAVEVVRNQVEADNAQLSLLCNAQGAEVLQSAAGEHGQPIYKVHPSPGRDALSSLEARIDATVDAHDLDARWRWNREERSLADYVRTLPNAGGHERLTAALMRQSIMVNVRSSFAQAPGRHHGVGAEVYGRFSAPMREIVGVFLHKEMFEALSQTGRDPAIDEVLRERVIQAANRSKQLQATLSRAADRLVIDDLFEADLGTAPKARHVHTGTVMGLRRGRVYVRLDSPPLDVKIYTDRLSRDLQEDEAGACLHGAGRRICRLGDAVGVVVQSRTQDGRWILDLAD